MVSDLHGWHQGNIPITADRWAVVTASQQSDILPLVCAKEMRHLPPRAKNRGMVTDCPLCRDKQGMLQ